jgi:hypothetical protein
VAVLPASMHSVAAERRPGRLKQAVCMGVFGKLKLDLDGKCREAARLGAWGGLGESTWSVPTRSQL